MASGGIVQIAVYGSQDIFLTGTPQITFFKVVYRRHTNFSIEQIQQQFVGTTNFGYEMTCVIDKLGDLMNKVYLEIDLPEVRMVKNQCDLASCLTRTKGELTECKVLYDMVRDYIELNTQFAKELLHLLRTSNISMEEIDLLMSDVRFIGLLVESRHRLQSYLRAIRSHTSQPILLQNAERLAHNVSIIDIQLKYWGFDSACSSRRSDLMCFVHQHLYPRMQDFYLFFYDLYAKTKIKLDRMVYGTHTDAYEFAWVEEIGHAIIDEISVRIGPQLIDRHTGDWMIAYNKITQREYQLKNYYKLIGNVPQLFVLNDAPKPSYKLIIPLAFWFCKYTGLSLPLIALRYHDVMFNLRLKDLSSVAYVSELPDGMSLQQAQVKYDINIRNAVLFVDYIFLDSDERRRFAQSTHEYLIETVQYDTFENILGTNANTRLSFAHPCRYMIFFCQPNQYRSNPTGLNKCQWNNFGTTPWKGGQPVDRAFIRLNSTNITDSTQSPLYFNYVVPYYYFRRAPTDGLYVYSFSTDPMEFQPNGTCNFSRIDDVSIEYEFSREFVRLVNQKAYCPEDAIRSAGICTGIYIGTYVVAYNIIRIMSGMCGLAFQTST